MCPIEKVHLDFDEYTDIVSSGLETGHDLHVLVDNYFKTKDLLLCIIESVTIGNRDGIGHTHLRFNRTTDAAMEKILAEYWSLVEKVKAEYKPGLSGYHQWYERHESAVVVGSHEVCNVRGRFMPKWANRRAQEKPGRSIYVSNHVDKLSDEWITTYLTRYVDHLDGFDWFKSVPHYVIVAKPLSLFDERDSAWLPLGNIYYLFGFAEKQEVDMLKAFVNQHIHIWLRNYGAQVARELGSASKKEVAALVQQHLPFRNNPNKSQLVKTPAVAGTNITLEALYKALFNGTHDHVLAEHPLVTEEHSAFKALAEVLAKTEGIRRDDRTEALRDIAESVGAIASVYRTRPELTGTSIDECLPDFAKRLSMRRIIQAYLVLCDAPLDFANRIRTGMPNRTAAREDSVIKYLIDQFWIPYSTTSSPLAVRVQIWDAASHAEKEFLRKLDGQLRDANPRLASHKGYQFEKILSDSAEG